jgi:hypothetical protein
MRGSIGYLVSVAMGVAFGACAEASQPPANGADAIEAGRDGGAAGTSAAAIPDAATASPDAATASPDVIPDAATAIPDAATAIPDAATAIPDAATADPGLEPTRVIRGNPADEFWDLTLRGEGLEHLDGRVVTVRVGRPASASDRLGSGQARIAGGRFELFLPGVWEATLYKLKTLYIDVDQNGRCDGASDLVFSDARAAMDEVLTVRVSPPFSDTDLRPSTEAAGHCEELNEPWPAE